MAVDIASLVGTENMQLSAKEKVIEIMKALDQPATTKRYLFSRWARLVGIVALPADLDRVAPWSQGSAGR